MSIISELDALKMAQTIRTIQLVEMKAKRRRSVERALYYRKLARERGQIVNSIYFILFGKSYLEMRSRDQGESR